MTSPRVLSCLGLSLPLALTLAPAVAGASPSQVESPDAPPVAPEVVGGTPVEACGWAPTLERNCTASLVHPLAITTAQHCGPINQVTFTDVVGGTSQTVGVVGCVDTGSDDARICELAEPVENVPPAPIIFGCEIDSYLQPGQPVVLVGFGTTSFGDQGSYGVKRWGEQAIAAVEAGRVIIGDPGDPISPCPGDSGGPAYVQVSDGSWRTIGTVLGGTTGIPCNSAADFQRPDVIVPHFETQTGIDITPCFDGQTGAWDPGPECGGFYTGDHTGAGSSGSWADWCAGTPASGFSAECGAPFGDDGGDGDGDAETGDGDGDGDADTGDGDGDPATGDGDGDGDETGESDSESGSDGGETTDSDSEGESGEETGAALDEDGTGGCACSSNAEMPRGAAWLMFPALLGLVSLRRKRA